MAKWLAAASIAWPLLLAAGWGAAAGGGPAWAASAVYGTAARVCHQSSARSFATRGVRWPVCGRCAGLYLSAPFGALAAWAWWRRRPTPAALGLVAAALPTVASVPVEWLGLLPVSSFARALAALPLGAAIGFYLVSVAAGGTARIGYTDGTR